MVLLLYILQILTHKALITVSRARIRIRIERPISNHLGLVFNEIWLPLLAPIIDPMRTNSAGCQIISPRLQYTIIAKNAVNIVTKRDVAIASWISNFIALKKGGNKDPPLPPLNPVIKFKKKAKPIMLYLLGLIFSDNWGAILSR